MESEEKIQAHVLSVWKESRGFFGGKGKEGMLILTNKRLLFIKKIEVSVFDCSGLGEISTQSAY